MAKLKFIHETRLRGGVIAAEGSIHEVDNPSDVAELLNSNKAELAKEVDEEVSKKAPKGAK